MYSPRRHIALALILAGVGLGACVGRGRASMSGSGVGTAGGGGAGAGGTGGSWGIEAESPLLAGARAPPDQRRVRGLGVRAPRRRRRGFGGRLSPRRHPEARLHRQRRADRLLGAGESARQQRPGHGRGGAPERAVRFPRALRRSRHDGETCARNFIQSFAARAYRRPLTAEDIDPLMALYRAGRRRGTGTYDDGIDFVTRAILQAPELHLPDRAGRQHRREPGGHRPR